MYNAKRGGRGRCAQFDEGMRRQIVDRLARENELRQAVDASLLSIHYQPIVSLATGEIGGMEALARWPEGWGAVPPSEFIAIAEETGMIGSLGQHVLRVALTTLAGWRQDGLVADDVCMSVNLSARQLDDPGLAAQVQAAIARTKLPPTRSSSRSPRAPSSPSPSAPVTSSPRCAPAASGCTSTTSEPATRRCRRCTASRWTR
jgi:predicted signal transduction protein with EAL and GGDEF domain